MSADRSAAVLKERARLLARVNSSATAPKIALDVVVFAVGGERYAIEAPWVKQVCRLRSLTPVPHSSPCLRGITNLRGRIVPVVDLRKFFELPGSGLSDLNQLVVVGEGAGEAGILADQVIGTRLVDSASLVMDLPTHAGARTDFLKGVTPEGLIVLDAAKLMADRRLLGFDSEPSR